MTHLSPVLVVLVLAISPLLYSQDFCYEHIDLAPIINILDTGEEVWMTTRGDGAFKYDKFSGEVVQYTEDDTDLISNYCNDLLLFEDQLLISTDTAILSYSSGQFDVYLDSIGGAMAISAAGRLIVSNGSIYTEWESGELYYEQDLFMIEGLNFTCGICDVTADITIDDEGAVWISHFGFYEFDILRFDGTDWTVYDYYSEGSEVLPIESFNYSNQILSHGGSIWASSWLGLNQHVDGQWNLYHNPSLSQGIANTVDTMDTHPQAMTVDTEGGLWIGSIGNSWSEEYAQLALLDDQGWHIYEGLSDYNNFQCLVASSSNEDIIYAGTSLGLSIIDKNCLTSSVSSIESPAFNMYVDQGLELLNLSNYGTSLPRPYYIYDTKGSMVKSGMLNDITEQISIGELSTGQYAVSILSPNSTSSRSFLKLN